MDLQIYLTYTVDLSLFRGTMSELAFSSNGTLFGGSINFMIYLDNVCKALSYTLHWEHSKPVADLLHISNSLLLFMLELLVIIQSILIVGTYHASKPSQNHFENVFFYDDDYYQVTQYFEQNNLYVSRVYWNANFNKKLKDVDPKYLYYKDGNLQQYTKYDKIGQGAFSEVFVGLSDDGKIVVMKELKPMKWQAINREIQVLKGLKGATNTLQLVDAIRGRPGRKQNATLIYEYLSSVNLLHLFGKLELSKIT